MNAEDLITLNEEIAGMARAGLPLDRGLAALAREMGRGQLRSVTSEIAVDLQAGRTLPEALERQHGRVPPFYAALLAAAVRSGSVAEVLATLTVYARSFADLRTTIVNALFYPAVVLAFAFGLFGFLCFFVFPQFEAIFRDFNMQLPPLTAWAFALGQHPIEFVVVPCLVVLGVFLGAWLVLRRTAAGRQTWARFIYAVPVVGTLVHATRLAAFTELLAILVDHAIPLPEAFRLAGASSSDPILAAASGTVREDLAEGKPLGEALRQRHVVPELIAWMVGLGEQRGTLGKALHQVADIYRRQAEMRAALLRTVLPPFLIVGTAGVIVGFFVFSIMLPMVKLLEGLAN